MSNVSKLEALLERVNGNRRPAPPDLAQLLAGATRSAAFDPAASDAAPSDVARVETAPATATTPKVVGRGRAPTPLEQALAAPHREPEPSASDEPDIEVLIDEGEATDEFADVQTGEFQVTQEELDARERSDREAQEREQAARESAAREAREREAAERAARDTAEREAREARDTAEREAREAAQREAAQREQPAAAAAAAPLEAKPVEAIAPRATGPVARISRPQGELASTFRGLMQRTLALRPRD